MILGVSTHVAAAACFVRNRVLEFECGVPGLGGLNWGVGSGCTMQDLAMTGLANRFFSSWVPTGEPRS